MKAEPAIEDSEERKLGGMLTTPRLDRQNQWLDAAVIDGAIDFSEYREFGRWTDTHRDVTVGYPCQGDRGLKRIIGKGWYTEGTLLSHVPNGGKGVERADYFWGIARSLKKSGSDRALGFSAEGRITKISECGQHILACKVPAAAVCEIPVNPDCKAEIIELQKAFLTTLDCDCLNCSPSGTLERALSSASAAALVPQDLEGAALDINVIITRLARIWNTDFHTAKTKYDKYLKKILREKKENGRKQIASSLSR